MLRCLSVRLVALAIMINLVGCVESSFNLSDDARLPKWFDIPEGMVREELTVTMDYYVMPSGGKAVFKLFDQNGKRLQKVKGVTRGKYPIELKSPPSGYPAPAVAAEEKVEVKTENQVLANATAKLTT